MASILFRGNPANTTGELPKQGQIAAFSKLVKSDLSEVTNETYKGKIKILNIFPSIDTGTCAASVRRFNKEASELKNTIVLKVSADLPFAQSRFCGTEGISNCESLTGFRSNFGTD